MHKICNLNKNWVRQTKLALAKLMAPLKGDMAVGKVKLWEQLIAVDGVFTRSGWARDHPHWWRCAVQLLVTSTQVSRGGCIRKWMLWFCFKLARCVWLHCQLHNCLVCSSCSTLKVRGTRMCCRWSRNNKLPSTSSIWLADDCLQWTDVSTDFAWLTVSIVRQTYASVPF